MSRIHILSSPEPVAGILLRDQEVTADCGKVLKDASLGFLFDTQAMQAMVEWAPQVCKKCRTVSDQKNARYVYGLVTRARAWGSEEE